MTLPVGNGVARRRELGRERSKKLRERLSLYGKGGYRVSTCYTPEDVTSLLIAKFPSIAEAAESEDKEEFGRALDWLVAAVAYGTLDSFNEDYEPGRLVV